MDNHATTRVDPRVVDAMLPFFSAAYGNASSVGHVWGDHARQAVEDATETVARSLNALSEEIIFTSGATESNNLFASAKLTIFCPLDHPSSRKISRKSPEL